MKNIYSVILFLFLPLIFPLSAFTQETSCEDLKNEIVEARDDRNFELERTLLEEGMDNICSTDSWVHSQLALAYMEMADRTYNTMYSDREIDRAVYFKKALELAREAEQLDPANYYAYEHKAMAFGGLIDVNRLRQKVKIADSVRINAEIALELLPDNDRAMHILGRWHYEVASLSKFLLFMARLLFGSAPDASMEQAAAYFKNASEVSDLAVHNYWLGLTYLRLNEPENARSRFQHVLDLPIVNHNDTLFKEQAREELLELE